MRKGESEKYGTGTFHENSDGDRFTVIEYRTCTDVDIVFDCEGIIRTVKAKDIARKKLVPHTRKSIMGVACKGYGIYKTTDKAGKSTKAYEKFLGIIGRVYDTSRPDYENYGGRGVTICEEWHNFQNFAEWFYNQPGHNIKGFEVDKDITCSTEYSPSNCYMIPKEINGTIRRVTGKKNTHLPRGVSYSRLKGKPYVSTFKESRNGSLVYFETIEEARKHYLENTKRKILNIVRDLGEIYTKTFMEFYLNMIGKAYE